MTTANNHNFLVIFIEIANIGLQVRPSPTYKSCLKKYASYLIFSSSKMRKRQEAIKLFTHVMHKDTMQYQWIVGE
jgi:hypothetical protein